VTCGRPPRQVAPLDVPVRASDAADRGSDQRTEEVVLDDVPGSPLAAEAHELARRLATAVAKTTDAKRHYEAMAKAENILKDELHKAITRVAAQAGGSGNE
jgi:hypothetical protein